MQVNFDDLNQVEVIITLIIGLLLLFAGYKIKKVAFFIVWFLIGYTLLTRAMPLFETWMPEVIGSMWTIILPIAGGLLLALMGFTIEKICVAGIVFGLALMIGSNYGTDIQTMAISGVIGVIAAGAAVLLIKPAIIVATAMTGAYTITAGIMYFSHGAIDPNIYYFPFLIGITVIGSVCQFLTTKRE